MKIPFAILPFLLLVVPAVEIAAFILIGGQIGVGWTLLMILVTAIIGTILLRREGFKVLANIQNETRSGHIPGRALGDGAMILVAGVLLLTPGFVTDALGFSLFVPFVRDGIWQFLAKRVTAFVPGAAGFGGPAYRGQSTSDRVVDLDDDEYTTIDPDDEPPARKGKNGSSPWRGP